MSLRKRLNLPREHGAWAMLYVPFVLGVLVAGKFTLPVVFLLVATTALFISRESLLLWWRARRATPRRADKRSGRGAGKTFLIYLTLGAAFGLPLIFYYRLYALLPFAAFGGALLLVNGRQASEFEDRSLMAELLAICGLTVTAPTAYYAARGDWDGEALWLWTLSALYFASSVFYVRLRVLSLNPRRQAARQLVFRRCAVYHAFLLAALVLLAVSKNLHLFALVAFAPVFLRTFWGLVKPTNQVNLRRAGVLEIVYSLVFLTFLTLTFR